MIDMLKYAKNLEDLEVLDAPGFFRFGMKY